MAAVNGAGIEGPPPHPESQADLVSRATFTWVAPLVATATQRPLQHQDCWALPDYAKLGNLLSSFAKCRRALPAGAQLWQVLHKVLGRDFWIAGGFRAASDVCAFASPVLINTIIRHCEGRPSWVEPNGPTLKSGLVLAVMLFVAGLGQATLLNQFIHGVFSTGVLARDLTATLVYERALRMRPSERAAFPDGRIATLQSSDCEQLLTFCIFFHNLWASPLMAAACIAFLLLLLGPAALAGVAVMAALIPLETRVAKASGAYRKATLKQADARLGVLGELFAGIRVVKLCAWEVALYARIAAVRDKELAQIRAGAGLAAVNLALVASAPIAVAVSSFVAYVMLGNTLTASQAFTALALFNQMNHPLKIIPKVIKLYSEVFVTTKRLQDFLFPTPLDGGRDHDAYGSWDAEAGAAAAADDAGKVAPPISSVAPASFVPTVTSSPVRPAHTPGGAGLTPSSVGTAETLYASARASPSLTSSPGASPMRPGAAVSMWAPPGGETIPTLVLAGASYTWGAVGSSPAAQALSFTAAPGALTLLYGRVAAGKSTVLSGILGECGRCVTGTAVVGGVIAYVPQQPWVINGSVLANVAVGRPIDLDRFWAVLGVCGLADDIAALAACEATEIGERGVNLSGGQKARLGLARALYDPACNIFLVDDPLSALDNTVAAAVMDGALRAMASRGICLVASSQPKLLARAGAIIALEGGTQVGCGTFKQLLAAKIELSGSDESHPHIATPETLAVGPSAVGKSSVGGKSGRAVMDVERRVVGDLDAAVYRKYIAACGTWLVVAVVAAFIAKQGMDVYRSVVLAGWSTAAGGHGKHDGSLSPPPPPADVVPHTLLATIVSPWAALPGHSGIRTPTLPRPGLPDPAVSAYLMAYAATGLAVVILAALRSLALTWAGLSAARRLHASMLRAVLASPLSFFEKTPAGRILSRFSRDVATLDADLPDALGGYADAFLAMAAAVLVVGGATGFIMLPVLLPLAYLYYRVQRAYRAASTELKRLDALSRSPLLSALGEALEGASSVRAFRLAPHLGRTFRAKVEYNMRARMATDAVNRWLGARLEAMGACVLFSCAALAVTWRSAFVDFDAGLILDQGWAFGLDAGRVGLILTFALTITQTLSFGVRASAQLLASFNSVERVLEYCGLPPEEPGGAFAVGGGEGAGVARRGRAVRSFAGDPDGLTSPLLSTGDDDSSGGALSLAISMDPPPGWPSGGAIQFHSVTVRYPGSPAPALRAVSWSCSAGEKVGVVGRTGSGKSTLTLALFRSLACEGGSITVDGIDVATVPLASLRSRLAIVLQEPVLFSGTVRDALDPLRLYAEADRVTALARANLPVGAAGPVTLDSKVDPRGANWSAGEQQLLALARALLQRSPVLVMDEATAKIDATTDAAIQALVRDQFSASTVLTIAHRLHDIIDCDKVMVMDGGIVAAFDTPRRLLSVRGGIFANLVADLGPTAAKKLQAMLKA